MYYAPKENFNIAITCRSRGIKHNTTKNLTSILTHHDHGILPDL